MDSYSYRSQRFIYIFKHRNDILLLKCVNIKLYRGHFKFRFLIFQRLEFEMADVLIFDPFGCCLKVTQARYRFLLLFVLILGMNVITLWYRRKGRLVGACIARIFLFGYSNEEPPVQCWLAGKKLATPHHFTTNVLRTNLLHHATSFSYFNV